MALSVEPSDAHDSSESMPRGDGSSVFSVPVSAGETETRNVERDQDLQVFADRLSKLAQLLDARAANLDTSETQLAQRRAALDDRHAKLFSIESRAREQVSALLSDIAARQATLATREARLRDAKSVLSSRLQAIRPILTTAAEIARQLPGRKEELNNLRTALDDHSAALVDARAALADANSRRDEAVAETSKLLEERKKLQRISDRLESMDKSLMQREGVLNEREDGLKLREDQVSSYTPLQRLIPPLQLLLDDLSTLRLESENTFAGDARAGSLENQVPPDVATDPAGAVRSALQLLGLARKQLGTLAEKRSELESERSSLDGRARRLSEESASLRDARATLVSEERAITASRRSIDRARAENEATNRALNDLRAQLDAREEALVIREARVVGMEDDVTRRENAVITIEQTLVRKERSLKRGIDAVTERERVVERRWKELEIEKSSVDCLRKDVQLREGLLQTKELEISARESRITSEITSALKSRIDTSSWRRGETPLEDVRESENLNVSVSLQEDTDPGEQQVRQPIGTAQPANQAPTGRVATSLRFAEDSQPAVSKPVETAGTVRRQLAFDSSTTNVPPTPSIALNSTNNQTPRAPTFTAHPNRASTSAFAPAVPPPQPPTMLREGGAGPSTIFERETVEMPHEEDAESEVAAEQLLPELISARAVWRERVTRLEEVVHNTRQQSWTVRPHLQPVLVRVANALKTLRTEVDLSPTTPGLSAKATYVQEQKMQRQWGEQLQEQLGAVREVQTGMLIGLREKASSTETDDNQGIDPTEASLEVPLERSEEQDDESAEGDEGSRDTDVNSGITELQESRVYSRGILTEASRSDSGDGSGTGSVEATLDATATITVSASVSSVDNNRLNNSSGPEVVDSFSRFREQMRQRRNALDLNPDLATAPSLPLRPANPLPRNVVLVSPRRDNLLVELTSLRNELRGITGFGGDNHQ